MEPTPEQVAARARLVRKVKLTQLFVAVSSVSIVVGFWLADSFLAAVVAGLVYGVALIIVGSLIMIGAGGRGAIKDTFGPSPRL